MKINNNGVTRIVIIFKTTVWKIPRFTYSWEHFLKGILANIQEGKTWKYSNQVEYNPGKLRRPLLCPVVFTSWGGWLLIMKKANIERHEKEIREEGNTTLSFEDQIKERYSEWIDAGLNGDDKPDNYGYYENRLVKVDYGQ